MDRPYFEDLGGSAELLKYIQERSDDIEKAVICPPGISISDSQGRQMTAPFPFFTLFLFLTSGETKVARDDDAEMILNDGILHRMKIKIELWKKGKSPG